MSYIVGVYLEVLEQSEDNVEEHGYYRNVVQNQRDSEYLDTHVYKDTKYIGDERINEDMMLKLHHNHVQTSSFANATI